MNTFSRSIKQIVLIYVFAVSLPAAASNEDSLSKHVVHSLEADVLPAYTIPTHRFLRGENARTSPIDKQLSVHLKYGFMFPEASELRKAFPYAKQGIGISYNTFFNQKELGSPLGLYVFQTSKIASLTPKVSLDYEWNFGATFGWKKADDEKNPYNRVVGSEANAYIHFRLIGNVELSPTTHLNLGIGISHYSNGNTSYPNSGVNTVGASMGVSYTWPSAQSSKGAKMTGESSIQAEDLSKHPIRYDIDVYGAWHVKGLNTDFAPGILLPGKFGVVGLHLNPLYSLNKNISIGPALDLRYDEGANLADYAVNTQPVTDGSQLRFHRPPFTKQLSLGVSARAEWTMSVFSINVGIGKNLIGKGNDLNNLYQMIALKTHINNTFYLYTGYQLYKFKEPNHLMLGCGFRL